MKAFAVCGLAVSLLLAFLVAPWASSAPDGLEKEAEETGFSSTATDHGLANGPLADYGVRGIGDDSLGTGVAGIAGVVLAFAAGYGLFALARPRSRPTSGG